jgi:hypothetical protein
MLREHKNHWLALIQEAGFDLSQFSAESKDHLNIIDEDEKRTFLLQLRDSPLKFMIRQSPESFDTFSTNNSEYKPGYPLRTSYADFVGGDSTYPLRNVDAQLRGWLQNVVRRYLLEQESPDLWAQVKEYGLRAAPASIPSEDLQSFSEVEKHQITAGLNEFKRLVAEQVDPLKIQIDALNERIDYLIERVDKLNRFDWKAQAFSTLVSIAVNLAVDTHTGRQLVSLFQQALGFIVGFLPPGLHI